MYYIELTAKNNKKIKTIIVWNKIFEYLKMEITQNIKIQHYNKKTINHIQWIIILDDEWPIWNDIRKNKLLACMRNGKLINFNIIDDCIIMNKSFCIKLSNSYLKNNLFLYPLNKNKNGKICMNIKSYFIDNNQDNTIYFEQLNNEYDTINKQIVYKSIINQYSLFKIKQILINIISNLLPNKIEDVSKQILNDSWRIEHAIKS